VLRGSSPQRIDVSDPMRIVDRNAYAHGAALTLLRKTRIK
jgi:hypothetical protein